MIPFGTYLLESSICLICFYSIFFALLKNETWFQLNRKYLLFSILCSVIIPLFHYSIDIPVLINVVTEGNSTTMNPLIITESSESSAATFLTFNNLLGTFLGIYLLGIIISSFLFIKGLLELRNFYKKGKIENRKGITYVFGENSNNVFSFFNCIFINKEIEHYTEKQQQQIIDHELAHIKDRHSWDLLLLEIFRIIFWFNPIVIAYKKSMLQLHEYIADEKVIEKEENALGYASFLVSQVKENTRVYSFCNHLFHKPIKNRLIMMNKSKSKGRNAIMAFSFIPVFAGMVFYFCIEYQEIPINIVEEKVVETTPTIEPVELEKRDSTPQPSSDVIPIVLDFVPEKGKCYGKSKMPNEYATVQKSFAVFTGKPTDGVEVEELEIVVSPAKEEWVKKEIEGACLSPDPNDCKVWCLVETPAVSDKVLVLKDINSTDQYEMKTFTSNELRKEGTIQWIEVLCEDKMTSDFFKKLQVKLNAEGYNLTVNGIRDSETRVALGKYQKENQLPVGNLDMATLKKLGL